MKRRSFISRLLGLVSGIVAGSAVAGRRDVPMQQIVRDEINKSIQRSDVDAALMDRYGKSQVIDIPSAGEFHVPTHFKLFDSDGNELTTWEEIQQGGATDVVLELAEDSEPVEISDYLIKTKPGELTIRLHEGDDEI